MRVAATIGMLCVVWMVTGCSEAGLHKADGRTRFAEALTSSEALPGCRFTATGKGKRELALSCEALPQAEQQQKIKSICEQIDKVGFALVTLHQKEHKTPCEVASGCSCQP